MMTTTTSLDDLLSQDVWDTRELIELIDYLTDDEDEDAQEELARCIAIRDEMEGYVPDFEYGETVIRESYFETYAQELADDIGAVPADASWPMTCINWAQAARELQMDYTAFEIDGTTWYAR